jgi:hypothetical protein
MEKGIRDIYCLWQGEKGGGRKETKRQVIPKKGKHCVKVEEKQYNRRHKKLDDDVKKEFLYDCTIGKIDMRRGKGTPQQRATQAHMPGGYNLKTTARNHSPGSNIPRCSECIGTIRLASQTPSPKRGVGKNS